MRRALLLALLTAACKDDPPAPPDCSGPDFVVVITAPSMPLPPDTVVHVVYGGGEEETHGLTNGGIRRAVFCEAADREGSPADPGGGGAGRESSSVSGEGGAGGDASGAPPEALRCELWTDGPAQVTLESELYPPQEPVDLEAQKGKCTVNREIEFARDDGGA